MISPHTGWRPVVLFQGQQQERRTTMSIERAERLKRELTDKWVVVTDGVPELKRFAEFTGKVKTVNMNCRALVEFDSTVDIGWYDIDPGFLRVVDGPRPAKSADAHAAKSAEKSAEKSAAKPAAKTPAAKPPATSSKPAGGGGSPLEKIRAAGSAGAAAAKPAAAGSPLDKIRAAGAGSKAPETGGDRPAAAGTAGSPLDKIRAAGGSAKPATPAGTSPLDAIRAQGKPSGGARNSDASAATTGAAPAVAKPADAAGPAAEPDTSQKPAPPKAAAVPGGSPLDQIRAQGAAKK